MTDTQLLTLAVAIIVPLSLLIYSNSRITDAKETLRAEMQALRRELLAEMGNLRNEQRMEENATRASLDQLAREVTALRVVLEEHLRVEHGWRGKP
jgi:hypothetical protein